MGKPAVPKNNVEYKFRFKKNYSYETYIVTLIYESTNEKGRYVFFNKKSGAFTSMPQKRFSYIHRFNLVSETPIVKKNKPSVIELERQKAHQKRLEEIAKERKQQEEIKEYIKQLKSLNKAKKEEVESIVQRCVEDIILELNIGRWTSRTSQEWYKIQHIIIQDNGVA